MYVGLAMSRGKMHKVGVNVSDDELFWSVTERALLSTTLLIIMIVAILGNSLVILVIVKNRGMRTRTNLFLCSLAVADLLCSVLAMPFSLGTVIHARSIYYRALCLATGFMTPLFIVASIHTLMYISVHRFFSVRYPYSSAMTRRRIIGMICAAWAWAVIASTVTISGLTEVNHSRYTSQCAPKYPDDAKSYAHLALGMLTCYVIPLIVIVTCSWGVFSAISSYGRHMRLSSTVDDDEIYDQQRHVAVTLILVVVMFFVCWTPLVVYAIYTTVVRDEERIHHLANPICWWFGYLNSACNPIIYAFRSEAFRDGYRQVICRRGTKLRRDDSTSTTKSRLSLRQRISSLLHRDSSLNSNVFNTSISGSVPGTYRRSTGDEHDVSSTALMSPVDSDSTAAQRSISTRRPRARPRPEDAGSDLIEMESFREIGVSFSEHEKDQSQTSSHPAGERTRKQSLMRFPSLEHLDRTDDGSPWRSRKRRQRKFRGGIGGLRLDRVDDPPSDHEDDIELDRITDDDVIAEQTRKPSTRRTSSVGRTASAAAKQREKQTLANPDSAPIADTSNRIYKPANRPQPPPPPSLAPRQPPAIDRSAMRVPEVGNPDGKIEKTEPGASRPRRQRRRRPRDEGDTELPSSAGTARPEHTSHIQFNGARKLDSDASTDVPTKQAKPEEVSVSERRRPSRRSDNVQRNRPSDTRTATFV